MNSTMGAVMPEMLSVEEATQQLATLKARLERRYGSVEAFRREAEAYRLDENEQALFDRLSTLEYLLGA
ncbi:hypothetical protein ACSBQY_03640 [Micrococcus lylae]|nr:MULTISPECIES: hypothetical protein [Micrococcus]